MLSNGEEYNPKTNKVIQDIRKEIQQASTNKHTDNNDNIDKPSTNWPYNTSIKYNESSLSDIKNHYDEKPRHKLVEPVNDSHRVHSNS